jgi:hypothetical protein
MSANPNKLPGLSSQVSEQYTCDASFKEYCLKHCLDAHDIWNEGSLRYPVHTYARDSNSDNIAEIS